MSGQPLQWDRFLLFSVSGILTGICSEGLGLLIGAAFSATVSFPLQYIATGFPSSIGVKKLDILSFGANGKSSTCVDNFEFGIKKYHEKLT